MSTIIDLLKPVLYFSLFIIVTSSGCRKDSSRPCQYGTRYGFSVTSSWSPEIETYQVGDTMILTSIFTKNLLDVQSNSIVQYSNTLGIYGNIVFGIMDSVSHSGMDARSKFQVFGIIGVIEPIENNPEKGVNIKYAEGNDYSCKVGVIFKEKGIFLLAVSNLGSQGIIGENCTNAGFGMTVTNTNKHFNLFQYALGYPPDALLQPNIYCFRVQ